jgi:hypothetical protein
MPHLPAAGRRDAQTPGTSNRKIKDGTWPPAPILRRKERPDPKLFVARFTPG